MIMALRQFRGIRAAPMMTLVKEVTAKVASFSPQLAFFASDDMARGLCMTWPHPIAWSPMAPTRSRLHPRGWSYGLFPNYRNVVWSCNWSPVTRFEYSRYAG